MSEKCPECREAGKGPGIFLEVGMRKEQSPLTAVRHLLSINTLGLEELEAGTIVWL